MVIPQKIREQLGSLMIFSVEEFDGNEALIKLRRLSKPTADDLRVSKNTWERRL